MVLHTALSTLSLLQPQPRLPTPSPQTRQDELITHRLAALEKVRSRLNWTQKWPSSKSIQKHAWSKSKRIPRKEISLPTPDPESGLLYRLLSPPLRPNDAFVKRLLMPAVYPRTSFPYPVAKQKGKDKNEEVESKFERFKDLPAEIRIQIWEAELQRPKMIEVQFESQISESQISESQISGGRFVGPCARPRSSRLLEVCRESRRVALAFAEAEKKGGRVEGLVFWKREFWYKHPGPIVHFVPERDTIFFRTLDRSSTSGLHSLRNRFFISRIQHLALPFPSQGLSLRNQWIEAFHDFENLKTLTFMLGGRDQGWVEDGEIELRDLEEWFADGREREYKVRDWVLDVGEVASFLGGQYFVEWG